MKQFCFYWFGSLDEKRKKTEAESDCGLPGRRIRGHGNSAKGN